MKKMFKVIPISLLAVLVLLAPACRTRKTPPPNTQPSVATSTVPDIPPPPPQTSNDTTVEPTEDFVRETPAATEETFPADIEALNRYVQEKGYVRDAFFNYDEAGLD